MYKALIKIGDYKKGDIVPDEKAELWLQMYGIPPVEKIEGPSDPKVVNKPKEKEVDSEGKMDNDYLDRNANVVKKSLEEDNLDEETLERLLDREQEDKNRKSVIEAIEDELEELD